MTHLQPSLVLYSVLAASSFSLLGGCDTEAIDEPFAQEPELTPPPIEGLVTPPSVEDLALPGPEILDGRSGQPVVHNGALRYPEVSLRWPDGAQVDLYRGEGDTVAVAVLAPADSPYTDLLGGISGINDAAGLFEYLAPDVAVPEQLVHPAVATGEVQDVVEFSDAAMTYLAEAGHTPASLDALLARALEAEALAGPDKLEFSPPPQANNDGCWHTNWFLWYIANTYPWPAHSQTCWWPSPEYPSQYVWGRNYGYYEFGAMNDHGEQRRADVLVTEKAWFSDGWLHQSNVWLWETTLNPSYAGAWYVFNIDGRTFGMLDILGSATGASHMAWEFYG